MVASAILDSVQNHFRYVGKRWSIELADRNSKDGRDILHSTGMDRSFSSAPKHCVVSSNGIALLQASRAPFPGKHISPLQVASNEVKSSVERNAENRFSMPRNAGTPP